MRLKPSRSAVYFAGLGLALTGLSGCQTWLAGLTLPSGYYLQHRPQYFPREPAFPLPRELATLQAQNAAAAAATQPLPAGRPPDPVPSAPADAVPVPVVPRGGAPIPPPAGAVPPAR